MKYKVFVDGQEGTTGLEIHDRLKLRQDLEVLKIDPEKRKDTEARSEFINKADIVFLCLPDQAAIESVSLVKNEKTRIIDASTAHRTNPEWAYGFPELSRAQRNRISASKRVAVPGCHATGFASILYPLVKEGIVPEDYPVTCCSLTGYSGGGKKLIERFEVTQRDNKDINSPKHYALKLNHKHLPEMQKVSGLKHKPLFTPVVANYYRGMAVSVPLVPRFLIRKLSADQMRDFLADYYCGEKFVRVMPFDSDSLLDNGFLNAESCNFTNYLDIYVFGNDEQILAVSCLDNLGKGASGAAVQNMNIMLELDEGLGL